MTVNYYEPPQPEAPVAAVKRQKVSNWPPAPASKKGFFRRFFGAIGATITFIRNTVMNIFFLLLVILIFAAIAGSAPQPLPAEFILKIKPQGQLVDQYTYVDPTTLLLADENAAPRETLLRDVIETIHLAATDDRVKGIHLDPSSITGDDISKLAEIGQALEIFKSTGKKVIATADNFSQGQYFLSTFANKIYVHELGSLWLTGLARYNTYLHSALEKLGVTIHTFRVGKFKDAIEPFMRDDMSPESREHNQEWVSMIWRNYTQQIEWARGLREGALNPLINNFHQDLAKHGGNIVSLLLEQGLVDGALEQRKLKNAIHNEIGKNANDKRFSIVDDSAYLAEKRLLPKVHAQNIALIVAAGNILDGNQPDGSIGDSTLVKKLRDARRDDSVKAVVIRIDSGGGSAFASDNIYQEIKYLRSKGKPVYVSMGRYAASGGYYIAAGADQIWAQPTTITGSIGVFGLWATLEESFKKLGINTDGVTTTDIAATGNLMLPLPEKSQQILQQNVEFIYNRFIGIVANSREQSVENIHNIAQGRVWTGEKALELGLVDRLGTLQDTIDAIAKTVGLTDYGVKVIERELSPKEQFLMSLANSRIAAFIPKAWLPSFTFSPLVEEMRPVIDQLSALKKISDTRGVLMVCLECQQP
ncbi:MAG: signal peptide peptidase SppA [Cellvibrio sp.]